MGKKSKRRTRFRGSEILPTQPECFIKFKNTDFRNLRERLLDDLSIEHFGVLLGKKETINGHDIINIYDIRIPSQADYENQSHAFLRLKKEFVYETLAELTNRYDVDSIVDVHTHPFSHSTVSFSGIDDRDERDFFHFLNETFDGLHYGSIVLSQREYSARLWTLKGKQITYKPAVIKTQTKSEAIRSSDFRTTNNTTFHEKMITEADGFFNRSTLVLGLDAMRQIMDGQVISIVGVGGLGSIIAEHLVHMGFHNIRLIDPDIVEISNLNRIVGVYYDDAVKKVYKVDAVGRHLRQINPEATIFPFRNDVYDESVEEVLALSDWIIVATDNHSSRFRVQQLSIKYFVPIITVGVNITVQDGNIEDMSGEVITARVGDNLCLNCLRRIDHIKIANETHPDKRIREELVKRGYVTGTEIKEPAVKTLNSMLATLTVETLINQYTERQRSIPILVYEDNKSKAIYEDKESVELRNKNCFTCNI